jgi:hypothetical protein
MDFETPTTMMDKFIFGREKKEKESPAINMLFLNDTQHL